MVDDDYFKDRTILDLAQSIDKHDEPYPYLIAEAALPDEVYEQLLAERPAWEYIAQDKPGISNKRIDINFRDVACGKRKVSPLWQSFANAHVSPRFYYQVCKALGMKTLGEDQDIQIIPRKMKSKNSFYRINMDCQIGINTPNTGSDAERVRGPHVDFAGELWGGMLYMPVPGDDAGGDLIIYKAKVPVSDLRFHGKAELEDEFVEEVDRCPYKPNTLVLFKNGIDCIHGVSPRAPGSHPRQLVNFLAETQQVHFALKR